MKKVFGFTCCIVLILPLLLVQMSGVLSAEESKEDPYIVTFEGGGIRLSEIRDIIKKVEYRKGSKLSKDQQKDLLTRMVEKELLYKKAVANGIDKNPEVSEAIHSASLDIVADAYLKGYMTDQHIRATDEEIETYYQKNLSKYNVPDLYHGVIFYVNKKDKTGKKVDEKSMKTAEEIRAYILEKDFQDIDDTITVFGQKHPDMNFDKFVLASYYKGKNIAVPQPVLDVFMTLKSHQAVISEQADFYAVIAATDFIGSQPAQLSVIKNRIVADIEAQKSQQAYKDLIDSLVKEYNYSFNTELLNKIKER